ncbi:hypothetical protein KZZ52_39565 [Dactylosporangium sp. AC04546]|uniref:hypothetical protein n=1 Tax=Dactylosporangium sp. AC04546 TaxID=2862460 RepID=UPI001EDCA485|nr:hypothetical protein [Dactylosporangium sp. AC04546]WVK80048.1 hypothetical protein KZZ52_39565 [Dactylosporangium sp. AC04546]
MTPSPLVRAAAIGAPVLLFLYGSLRLLDGADGHHDKGGPLWNAGHALFFVAFLLLGALTVGVRRLVPVRTFGQRWLANVATAFGVFGAACFLVVITGDLSPAFADAFPLPGPLELAGPALFQLGVLTLLVLLVRAGRLPVWSPALVFAGFVAIAVNLDFIPLAAVLLLGGLAPLNPRQPAGVRRTT